LRINRDAASFSLSSKLSFFLWERHLAAKPSRRDAAPTKTGLT
jgi:hypothetical protein